MVRVLSLVLGLLIVSPTLHGADIRHAFLATGGQTFIQDESGKEIWSFPDATRDGWVLPSGNILLAVGKGKRYPCGAVVEVNRKGSVVFVFPGTQSEVNTVQPLPKGIVLLTEAGDKPRLIEVERFAVGLSRSIARSGHPFAPQTDVPGGSPVSPM